MGNEKKSLFNQDPTTNDNWFAGLLMNEASNEHPICFMEGGEDTVVFPDGSAKPYSTLTDEEKKMLTATSDAC